MPEAGFHKEQLESVGGLVGKELAIGSLVALGLGILGILIYVSVRFELSFAVGAIVALLHDVIITLGIFSLLGRELSLVIVGAILTIAGYSVNDTIVVFDRIREKIKAGGRGSVASIMNTAVNETLSRTILTGGVAARCLPTSLRPSSSAWSSAPIPRSTSPPPSSSGGAARAAKTCAKRSKKAKFKCSRRTDALKFAVGHPCFQPLKRSPVCRQHKTGYLNQP
jgi:hypothetical protein